MIDDIDDMEWRRQEQARQAEQKGVDTEDADTLARGYRRVARALAQDPDVPLPSNFSHSISTRIEAIVERRRRDQARFERLAFTSLAAVSSTGVIIALAFYGDGWWSLLQVSGWTRSQSAAWVVALAGCGLLSQLLNRVTHQLSRPR